MGPHKSSPEPSSSGVKLLRPETFLECAGLTSQDLAFAQLLTGHLFGEVAGGLERHRRGNDDKGAAAANLHDSLLREVATIMAFTRKAELENSLSRAKRSARHKRRGKSRFGAALPTCSKDPSSKSHKELFSSPRERRDSSSTLLAECISDTYAYCCVSEQLETEFGLGTLEKGFALEESRWQTKLPKFRIDEVQELLRALGRLTHLEQIASPLRVGDIPLEPDLDGSENANCIGGGKSTRVNKTNEEAAKKSKVKTSSRACDRTLDKTCDKTIDEACDKTICNDDVVTLPLPKRFAAAEALTPPCLNFDTDKYNDFTPGVEWSGYDKEYRQVHPKVWPLEDTNGPSAATKPTPSSLDTSEVFSNSSLAPKVTIVDPRCGPREVPITMHFKQSATPLFKLTNEYPSWRKDLRQTRKLGTMRDVLPPYDYIKGYIKDVLHSMKRRNLSTQRFPIESASYWALKYMRNRIDLLEKKRDEALAVAKEAPPAESDTEGESEHTHSSSESVAVSDALIADFAHRCLFMGEDKELLTQALAYKNANLTLTGRHLYSAFLSAPVVRHRRGQAYDHFDPHAVAYRYRSRGFGDSSNMLPHRRRPNGPCLSQYNDMWLNMSDESRTHKPFERYMKELGPAWTHDPFGGNGDIICSHCVNTILDFIDEAAVDDHHAKALTARLELSFPFVVGEPLKPSIHGTTVRASTLRSNYRLQEEFTHWISLQLARESASTTDEVDIYTYIESAARGHPVRTDLIGHFPIASGKRFFHKRASLWYKECCVGRLPSLMRRHALSPHYVFVNSDKNIVDEELVGNRPASRRQPREVASQCYSSDAQGHPNVLRLAGIIVHDRSLVEKLRYIAIAVSHLMMPRPEKGKDYVIPAESVYRPSIYVTPSGRSTGRALNVNMKRRKKIDFKTAAKSFRHSKNSFIRQFGMMRYTDKFMARGWEKDSPLTMPECFYGRRNQLSEGGFVTGKVYSVPHHVDADEALRLLTTEAPETIVSPASDYRRIARVKLMVEPLEATKLDYFVKTAHSSVTERLKKIFSLVQRGIALQQFYCLKDCLVRLAKEAPLEFPVNVIEGKESSTYLFLPAEGEVLTRNCLRLHKSKVRDWIKTKYAALKPQEEWTLECRDITKCDCITSALKDPDFPPIANSYDELYLELHDVLGPGVGEWWRLALGLSFSELVTPNLEAATDVLWESWSNFVKSTCDESDLLAFLKQEVFVVETGHFEPAIDFVQCFSECWGGELAMAAASEPGEIDEDVPEEFMTQCDAKYIC
eukprot:Blabericola_migrator_1__1383@NODE_135_length_13182_cov_103_341289_g117_i0_p1_GENE_NODE_135_length_13182_cov_103_341289_g117_i0NODE_135_length_13182_cov_103_341289_g117_i0_p1_ORF_typecomplete_len1269_score201_95_NODE_135_length_13182_cov_103_341289_g117_i048448650